MDNINDNDLLTITSTTVIRCIDPQPPSGEGVGHGPTRATWSAIISRIVSNTSQWMEAADSYYTPTNMMPLSITPGDVEDFKFYGFLFWQSLIWGLDPFPISPFFLAVALADLKSATSLDYHWILLILFHPYPLYGSPHGHLQKLLMLRMVVFICSWITQRT